MALPCTMSEFEYYISFYGLLLGLSVAEVASKFLNVIGARRTVTIGWLTPALVLFIFLDITSFWIYAWGMRDALVVNWRTMFAGLLVALSYYFAAGLALPRHKSEWPDLEEYYWQHKRIVLGGILVANLISFTFAHMNREATLDFIFWFNQLTYFPPLIMLFFTRRRWLDLSLFGILIIGYFITAFLPSWIVDQ